MVETLQAGVAQTGAVLLLGKLAFQLRRLCDWENWRVRVAATCSSPARHERGGKPVFTAVRTAHSRAATRSMRGDCRRNSNINADPGIGKRRARSRDRLRIGYFSSDFYENAVAYLVAEVLELHDRSRFEVFAYSYGPDDNSAMRNRMCAACEHFIDVARDPDDVIAARIRADELDILIDLKGYTMGARPSVLARRPCAIQVNWLGYPGTMGAEFIDYLIADSFIVPPGQESNYAESVLRMPHCYQPNDRKRPIGAVA